jgi:hypothetical protein
LSFYECLDYSVHKEFNWFFRGYQQTWESSFDELVNEQFIGKLECLLWPFLPFGCENNYNIVDKFYAIEFPRGRIVVLAIVDAIAVVMIIAIAIVVAVAIHTVIVGVPSREHAVG